MVAPKNWGYTRDESFGDEMLVSWSDGDLTAMLTKEVVERLLHHEDERRRVAQWARAAHATSIVHGKDWIVDAPKTVVEACKEL